MRHSRETPTENLHRAVYFVVLEASAATPVVSMGKIDAELQVTTSPAVLKSGKLSRNKKRQREVVTARSHKLAKGHQGPRFVPLAALIIQAQVLRVDTTSSQPGMSRFNRMTGMRWARLQSPFKGVSRRTGANKMRQAISRLTKARHSSSGFFKASWRMLLVLIGQHTPAGFRTVQPGKGGRSMDPAIANFTPAVPGKPTCSCTIENRMGMRGTYPALDERRNIAAHRILAPALARAIEVEFQKKMVSLAKRNWEDSRKVLADLGYLVRT